MLVKHLLGIVMGAEQSMDEILFEWDEQKAWSNERKHGVSFDEAQTVFYDQRARLSFDPDHSQDEDRYILLGMSSNPRLLVVAMFINNLINTSELSLPAKQPNRKHYSIRAFSYEKRV